MIARSCHWPLLHPQTVVEHEGRGNTGAACKIYQSIIERHPLDALAHQGYARLLHAVGERDAAVSQLEVATSLDPSQFEAYKLLSSLKMERGEIGAARQALCMAARIMPSDVDLIVEQAESTMAQADLARDGGTIGRARKLIGEAQRALESALDISPSSHRALLLLSAIEQDYGGDMGKRRDYLERAWRLSPSMTDVGIELGVSFLLEGSHASAAKAMERVIQVEPGHVRARCLAASALFAMNDRTSLTMFEEALELDPDNSNALCGYGLCLKAMEGDMEGAEAAYRTALRIRV